MFFFRVFLVIPILAALTQTAPIEIVGDEQAVPDINTPIPILSQTDDISPDGSFSYSFETANHIKQQANGYHKTVLVPRLRADGSSTGELDSADIIVQTGSYSYLAPDGTLISVQFVADENGFHASGDHLPTAPSPLPESILHVQSNQQLAEEQSPPPTNQLLATQGNAIVVASESAAIQSNESQQRQQRSSFLPPLFQ